MQAVDGCVNPGHSFNICCPVPDTDRRWYSNWPEQPRPRCCTSSSWLFSCLSSSFTPVCRQLFSCSFKLSVGWWRSVWTWVRIMIFSMISAAQVPCMVVYAGSSNLVVPWQGWGFPCLALKTARLDRSFPMRDYRNQPPGPSVGI